MNRVRRVLKKVVSEALQFFIVLTGVTLLTFFIMYLSPKNPAELWLAGSDGNVGMISEEAIRKQEQLMGLDQPFIVQYIRWLGRALNGDLGISFVTKRPVAEMLLESLPPTLSTMLLSLTVTVLISVPAGIFCAVYKDRLFDNLMRIFSFIGISAPSFLLSLIFLWIFCMKLQVIPVLSPGGFRGLLLPSAVLIVQCSAKMIRQIRAIILEQLERPYVYGAMTRGVPFRTILFSHVLKNSAAAILTCVGLYAGLLMGGSAVIEGIFSVNGIGRLAVSSVARLDLYAIQGFVLLVALIYLAVNLLVDVLSALIDPRVKYGRGAER